MKDHFSDETTIVEKDEEGFHRAMRLFACTILDCEMPQDVQYVYLAPGGDHQIRKDLLTAPRDHARRFKEMLRIAELLPPGKMPLPSEKLTVQWYYMTYHCTDRAEYVKSGKNCPTRPSRRSRRTSSRSLHNARSTGRSNNTRSSVYATTPSGHLRMIFERNARRAA